MGDVSFVHVCMRACALASPPKETEFGKTPEVLEGFCFVIFLRGLKSPNIEKDDHFQISKDMKFALFLFLYSFLNTVSY